MGCSHLWYLGIFELDWRVCFSLWGDYCTRWEGACIVHASSALVLIFMIVGISVYVLYIVHARG